MSLYLATFAALAWVGVPYGQWAGLAAVTLATALTISRFERRGWPLGLAVRPSIATRELIYGMLFAAVLIGVCDVLLLATSGLHRTPGLGFPWSELVVVYIPAVLHEELLFRGYPYQKLRALSRGFTVPFTAAAFAALHLGNRGITTLALLNLFLGGVLLALAYERYERLWFPIGLHFGWNIVSGPILGHFVSGFAASSIVGVAGSGPVWLTGGEFGIEGSVWMTAVELVAIAVLAAGVRSNMIRAPHVPT